MEILVLGLIVLSVVCLIGAITLTFLSFLSSVILGDMDDFNEEL
jgi:hypothetical protein